MMKVINLRTYTGKLSSYARQLRDRLATQRAVKAQTIAAIGTVTPSILAEFQEGLESLSEPDRKQCLAANPELAKQSNQSANQSAKKVTAPMTAPAITKSNLPAALAARAAEIKPVALAAVESTADFLARHKARTVAAHDMLVERMENLGGKLAATNLRTAAEHVASLTSTPVESVLRKIVNSLEQKNASNSPKLLAARANLSAHAALKGSTQHCAPCLSELEAIHGMVFGAKASQEMHTWKTDEDRSQAILESFFKARIQVFGADYSGFTVSKSDENKLHFDAKRLPQAREAVNDFFAALRNEQPVEKLDSLGSRVAREYTRSLSGLPSWKNK